MTVGLAFATVTAVASTFALGAAAGATAPAGGDQPNDEPVAILTIIEPSVSIQREGKDVFKPAKDGQKLRVGDTVQTDATGFAQIDYTDDSFTRLDVDTTFTIVSLSDDEGNRQIKGSVESGQTWNRTSALTESESFEQEGAGATAAVTGTAFAVSCTSPGNCTFISVVDGIQLTTVDGEVQQLAPLEQCGATEITDEDADLCAAVEQVTIDALIANAWILENLFIDGLAGLEGVIIVSDGQVVSFTQASSTPPQQTPANETQPNETPPPPDVDEGQPIDITDPDAGPSNEIVTDDQTNVSFVFIVSGATYVQFTDKPEPEFGRIFVGVAPDFGNCASQCINLGTKYDPSETFWFAPEDVAYPDPDPSIGSFTFVAGNEGGTSDPVQVNITVNDAGDSCAAGSDVEVQC